MEKNIFCIIRFIFILVKHKIFLIKISTLINSVEIIEFRFSLLQSAFMIYDGSKIHRDPLWNKGTRDSRYRTRGAQQRFNKFAPLIAPHDRSIMRAWCEPSWWMKESECSKDSDWISPPSKGERLGFTFDPSVLLFYLFLSFACPPPVLRSSSVSPIVVVFSFAFVIILSQFCALQFCNIIL